MGLAYEGFCTIKIIKMLKKTCLLYVLYILFIKRAQEYIMFENITVHEIQPETNRHIDNKVLVI